MEEVLKETLGLRWDSDLDVSAGVLCSTSLVGLTRAAAYTVVPFEHEHLQPTVLNTSMMVMMMVPMVPMKMMTTMMIVIIPLMIIATVILHCAVCFCFSSLSDDDADEEEEDIDRSDGCDDDGHAYHHSQYCCY